MKAVRSKGNKSTEIKLIEHFHRNSIKGWWRNYKLIGNPDFVFPLIRLVVFADGCFWHGHNCRNTTPSANRYYWENKSSLNKKRDRRISAILREKGWIVIRIWECEINKNPSRKLSKIKSLMISPFKDMNKKH